MLCESKKGHTCGHCAAMEYSSGEPWLSLVEGRAACGSGRHSGFLQQLASEYGLPPLDRCVDLRAGDLSFNRIAPFM
jgi:hypothetical protein